jgi:DNA-directed RNA polymerase specialized sigma24 family protein
VEFRFFGDLDFQEIAEVMNLSLTTVERDWRFARAWLQKKMAGSLDE